MNTLRQSLDGYLTMRRSLGFKLLEPGHALSDFVTYMEQHDAPYITQALALSWALQPTQVQPATCAKRLSDVRLFARYCIASDPRTQIPPPGLLPFKPKRSRPYLYTDKEIELLVRGALELPQPYKTCALLPWVYYCAIGLLSVTGLRLGEVTHLEVNDVDLEAAVLTIRNAKFGKTRLLPLHASTCQVLKDYIVRRQKHWNNRLVSPYLFVSSKGNRVDNAQIRRMFYRLSRQIGLRGATDSRGPRLHDYADPRVMPTSVMDPRRVEPSGLLRSA